MIEVAESSLSYDRETKAPLYAVSSVEAYWLVDVRGQCVEVFSAPDDGRFTKHRRAVPGDVLALAGFADIAVRVSDLVV